MEPKPEYILSRGQPSIKVKYREDTKGYRAVLPVSFIEHLKARGEENGISAAEYLRQLIAADMTALSPDESKDGNDPDK